MRIMKSFFNILIVFILVIMAFSVFRIALHDGDTTEVLSARTFLQFATAIEYDFDTFFNHIQTYFGTYVNKLSNYVYAFDVLTFGGNDKNKLVAIFMLLNDLTHFVDIYCEFLAASIQTAVLVMGDFVRLASKILETYWTFFGFVPNR